MSVFRGAPVGLRGGDPGLVLQALCQDPIQLIKGV
jgi:hypothetical protein